MPIRTTSRPIEGRADHAWIHARCDVANADPDVWWSAWSTAMILATERASWNAGRLDLSHDCGTSDRVVFAAYSGAKTVCRNHLPDGSLCSVCRSTEATWCAVPIIEHGPGHLVVVGAWCSDHATEVFGLLGETFVALRQGRTV
jgi:hypothetical protein